MDSVFVNDNGTAVLSGILDHIEMTEPVYELPNQDEDPTTEQADVYRISAMTYELLTGELPNHPDVAPDSHLTSSLTDKLDDVLIGALSPHPADRPETVLHLRDEFESI
jgi:serine/threonine protein kinase